MDRVARACIRGSHPSGARHGPGAVWSLTAGLSAQLEGQGPWSQGWWTNTGNTREGIEGCGMGNKWADREGMPYGNSNFDPTHPIPRACVRGRGREGVDTRGDKGRDLCISSETPEIPRDAMAPFPCNDSV